MYLLPLQWPLFTNTCHRLRGSLSRMMHDWDLLPRYFGIFGDKFGYGFGFRTERWIYDELESIGSYGWDGAFYTKFWVDPKEDLIGIFMSNMNSNDGLISKFKVLVYQSITD